MAKKLYLISTLSAPQKYTVYGDAARGVPREQTSILVNGGANVANKNLITPQGVYTEITEDQLAILKENKLFQTHEKNGFIKVDDKKIDTEKAVSDLEKRDEAAPLTPGDFEPGKAPTTGAPVAKKK
jgi:hypothetical protein